MGVEFIVLIEVNYWFVIYFPFCQEVDFVNNKVVYY